MTTKVNPLALVGLDCPACQGAQFCEPECICPVCFPDRFMTSVEDSVRQWGEFAPALACMNDSDIKWDWSTSYGKPTVHSVEVATSDTTLVEVFVRGGKFHAEYCEYDKRDNFWNVTRTASFMHPHEVTDWVNQFR
jgi:hypothetical protein